MLIGFLCTHNPLDRNAFSGTPYYMLEALRARPDVELRVLGGHRPPSLWSRSLRRLRGAPRLDFADAAAPDLDWIVAPVSSDALAALADAPPPAPVVHVTDATPGFLRTFYGWDIPPDADAREAKVIRLARRVFYSSDIMLRHAEAEFGREAAAKATAIPFGSNLDDPPTAPPPRKPVQRIELLFIGKDWVRKGGDIALATLDALRIAHGRDVRLTVVGTDPESARGRADVEIHPYLDKNQAEGRRIFSELFARAHFLILPSRADCTPMVIAEANAHGVPVLASEVGGIPSLVEAGVSGFLFDAADAGEGYARRIVDVTANPAAYHALTRTAYDHYTRRLTWSAWAAAVTTDLASSVRDLVGS